MKYICISLALVGSSLLASPCLSPHEAMNLAEFETGGEAVRARLVPHNGSFGKWEVQVRMANQDEGWQVFIDRDNGKVLGKKHIPNPPRRDDSRSGSGGNRASLERGGINVE
jgi:hypothetical protein